MVAVRKTNGYARSIAAFVNDTYFDNADAEWARSIITTTREHGK